MQATPVYVSLARGLVQSTDPDMVSVNQGTLRLENCVIQQKEAIVKRAGTVAIGNLDINGNPVPVFTRLLNRGDSLLGLAPYGSPSALYAYSFARDRWVPVSSTLNGPTSYSLTTVAGGQFSSQSSAYLPGYVAIGFVNANGEGEARIIDEQTGGTLFSSVFTAAGGETGRVRVVACNSLFVWLADDYNNQQIDGMVADPTNPIAHTFTPSSLSIHPTVACLDAIAVGSTVHAAYATQSGQVQEAIITPTSGGATFSTREVQDTSGRGPHVAPSECMSYVRDLGGSGKIGLVVVDLVFGVRLLWDIGGTGATALSYIMEGAQSLVHHSLNVTACTTSNAAGGDVQVIAELAGPDLFTVTCAGALPNPGWTKSGGPGVGKQLHAPATGTVTVNGHLLALNETVLVTGNASLSAADLGIYKVTTAGAVGVTCILTRATNFDTAAEITRDCVVRATNDLFPNFQYHIVKVPDAPTSLLTPGYFAIDFSAIRIDAFASAFKPQTALSYRRYDRFLWTAFKTAANALTNAQWTRGLGLTSNIYQHGGHRFVWATYDNDGELAHQGSYFLLECPATIASGPATPQAAFAVDSEAGIVLSSHLQDVAINQDGNALGSILVRANAVATDDGQRSVQLAEITLNPPLGHHVELGGALFTPSGVLGEYDGRNYFPPVFPFAPDGFTASPSSTVGALGDFTAGTVNASGTTPPGVTIDGTAVTPTVLFLQVTTGVTFAGGATSTGRFEWSTNRDGSFPVTGVIIADTVPLGTTGLTAHFPPGTYATDNVYKTTSQTIYRLAAVFRSEDANGRMIRSAPSFFDVTLYAGQSSISLDWVPFYRLGDKPNVYIEIYRSQANVPEVLNLSDFGPVNPAVDFNSFVEADEDARVAVTPLLYTSGGVLDSTPVGGISELCVQGNRLFAVEMDDPTIILASTPLARGQSPAFTDSNYLPAKTPVAALASFVDNLIVFEASVYGMPQSDGPNSQGQGVWPELQVLDPAVTTTQPLSVAVTPGGVAFLSQNPLDGYQMLNRSLLVEPFGIDINQFLPANAVSTALYVSAQSQLRIYTTAFGAGAGTLVFDDTHNQWSVFTGQDALSAAIAPAALGGRPVYCAFGSGAVRVESPGNYLEATTSGQPGVAYDEDLVSPWIQIYIGKTGAAPNVGGFFRLRDIVGKGRSTGFLAATLNIDLLRDFSTTPAISLQTTHPNDGAWKFRGGFKCSALQVHMRISQASGLPPVIMGFTAGICAKPGMRRISGRNAQSL